jgi:ABC-2 type transport system permease protein
MQILIAGINVFKGQVAAELILLKRYWLNLAAGTVNVFLFLIFIQLGIRSFGGGASAEFLAGKMGTLIVGFFSFSIIGVGISSITARISDNAATGILEQTMLSPIGIAWVLFFGAFAQFITALLLYLLLIPVTMFLCGHFFRLNILQLISLTVPLWLASCGVGFILGAVSLIYKKTQSFSNLIQFLILALMAMPSYPFNVYSLLPISPQAAILNKVIVLHQSIGLVWSVYSLAQSAAYLILGSIIFKEAEKYAKEKGILGQY